MKKLIAYLFVSLACTVPSYGQDLVNRVKQLEKEIATLKAEIATYKTPAAVSTPVSDPVSSCANGSCSSQAVGGSRWYPGKFFGRR